MIQQTSESSQQQVCTQNTDKKLKGSNQKNWQVYFDEYLKDSKKSSVLNSISATVMSNKASPEFFPQKIHTVLASASSK